MSWMGVLIFLTLTRVVHSQGSTTLPPPADRDSFVGVWQANADKSQPKLTRVQRTYVRTIERIGKDIKFSSSGGDSKAKIRSFLIRCDGSLYPLPTGPVMSCRWVDSRRVEGETRDPRGRESYWAREVTADGQTMTITEFKDKTRTKVASVMALDRVK